jgi:hypothetical protein
MPRDKRSEHGLFERGFFMGKKENVFFKEDGQ